MRKIHLYTATAQEAAHYGRAHPDLFASITAESALYAVCREPVDDDDLAIEEARRNESELGVTINELAVSDRHLGRGFALGGFNHPRSRISEETSYLQMVNGFNAVIAFWAGAGSQEAHVDLERTEGPVRPCASRGTPVRMLAGARFKNYYYWAINEYLETPAIEAAFARAEPNAELDLSAPYASHLRYRAHFRQQASTHSNSQGDRPCGPSAGLLVGPRLRKGEGYYLRENVRYLWRRRKDVRKMTRAALPDLAQFQDVPFAFFPLATEPETALQTLSPEYLYQLPRDHFGRTRPPCRHVVAVKEHYAASGRRPSDFYAQIADLKNVRLMNMAELGIDVARASRAVVTISGTRGFEGCGDGQAGDHLRTAQHLQFPAPCNGGDRRSAVEGLSETAFSDAFDRDKAVADGRRFCRPWSTLRSTSWTSSR